MIGATIHYVKANHNWIVRIFCSSVAGFILAQLDNCADKPEADPDTDFNSQRACCVAHNCCCLLPAVDRMVRS
jgi:hypothetical protein